MDIYISRCSFLHDSTLVPVTTEQSRECMASRRLLQGSLQTLLHRPLSFNFIATLIFWYEKLKCTHPSVITPPSTHTRASKLRNTVVWFPQPVCSLVTRHQRLAAAATSISGRQSVVEWPINHNPNVLNRSQLDGTESFLVFPSAIFHAVWKTGYVSVFFLPLFRLIFLPTETL